MVLHPQDVISSSSVTNLFCLCGVIQAYIVTKDDQEFSGMAKQYVISLSSSRDTSCSFLTKTAHFLILAIWYWTGNDGLSVQFINLRSRSGERNDGSKP